MAILSNGRKKSSWAFQGKIGETWSSGDGWMTRPQMV
jgi:hypothetical protein